MTTDEMKERIKKQLNLRKAHLFCKHNSEKACDDCMKNIWGNVSNIKGDVTDIKGNVSGIRGDATEIIELLKRG